MDREHMFELAQALGEAKSRQDVEVAMTYQHEDMVLTAPSLGSTARGKAENEIALRRFFKSFPDYEVTLDGHATDGESLVCWGLVRMTMTGEGFGVTPNGRRAELPVFIRFTFEDGLIASERFFFDLAELCAQSGVSADTVHRRLFGTGSVVAHG